MKKKVFSAALVLSLALTGSAMADPALTQVSEVSDVEWIDGTNLFRAQDEEGYYMADIDGNAVSKSGYASSFGSSNGFITAYSMAVEGANAEGLLAPDGTEVIECKYGDIKVPNEHWAAAFVLTPADANNYDYQALLAGDGDKYYLIETVDFYHLADGKATLTGSFPRENCLDYYAQGDYLSVEDRTTNKVTMYDGSWNVVAEDLSSVYTEPDGIPVSGYEIYSENGQQGVKDADGNVLIEPAYKYVYDVENGYVRVSTGDLYGLLDLNGNVIVPAEADEIARCYYVPSNEGDSSYVSAGYAAAFVGGKLAFYDMSGKQTVEPTLSKDLVEVNGASATYTDLEGKKHILAADGVDTVLDEAHQEIRPLYHGSGLLYEFQDADYKKGLIDWHGNELLPIGQYDLELSGDGRYLIDNTDYDAGILYEVDYGMGNTQAEAT